MEARMKSRLNLKPGQKGTKKLVQKYGDSLIYVRYRYDESRGIRQTTVELVEEEAPWRRRERRHDSDLVAVTVGFAEKELRARLKDAGGKWDPEQKVWHVTYGMIRGTKLVERIVGVATYPVRDNSCILSGIPVDDPIILNEIPTSIS
jgi:hypothetical protein